MSRKNRRKQQTVVVTRPNSAMPAGKYDSKFEEGMEATRSFYSNAVAWGTDLLTDARDEYSIDDATAARLYAITVTAWICANFRADTESGIPPIVVDDNKKPVPIDDNPLIWFVENHAALMFKISISLLIWGKFYLRKVYNARGFPTRLEWLNPLDVSPAIDYENDRFLGFRVRGRDNMVPPEQMIVDMTFDPLNDFDGVSAYEVAMRQIIGNRELVRFGQKYFQEGTMLGGMLTYEGDLDDEDYKRVKAEFQQFKGSQNAFRTFVAGGGMAKFNYQAMQPNPVDLAMPDFKAMLDGDTCRAFGVNPILVGIGDAKDPLSANNTYQQVENKFVEKTALPRVKWIYESLDRNWLKANFASWGNYRLIADESEIMSVGKAQPERSTMAVANVGRIWTTDEGRDFTGKPPLPFPAIQINPDWAMAVYREGGITHDQFRQAIGLEPDPRVKGYIWEVDPRVQAVALPNPPKNLSLPQYVEPLSLPARTVSACYVILLLANNPRLLEVQNALRAQYPAMDWTPAKDFHVTLVHAPIAPNLEMVKSVLPRSINSVALTAGPVETFPTHDGKQPVILRVAPDQTLVALQSGLSASFKSLGLELSPYSDPAKWQPHITLGYIEAGQPAPQWDRVVTIASDTMVCSIENGGSFQSIAVTRQRPDEKIIPVEVLPSPPMRSDPLLTKARLFELDNWQKKVGRKGIGAAFDTQHLPEPVAQYVRSELAGLWNPKSVFNEAKRAVRQGVDPRPQGATPEDAQDYWRDFDALQVDMGAAFTDYLRAVSGELFNDVVERRQVDMDAIFNKSHASLSSAWVGDLTQPGPLLAIILAGIKAGDRSLQKEMAANPLKPRAFDVGISWDLLSQNALTFAHNYSFDLIRRIDDTTRDSIRGAVEQQITEGFGQDQLRDLISQILVPPGGEVTDAIRTRAGAIADTESDRAFNEGAFQRWRDAGVTEATWMTVRDDKVCPICRRLHGQTARISDGWYSSVTGQRYTSSAHTRDRCFRRPEIQ